MKNLLATSVYVGVSGFSYPSWKGNFYPKELKNEQFLEYYSSKLNSVEINSTFYAFPNRNMVDSWNQRTPETFRLSFKAPRQITHNLKLGKGSEQLVQRFAGTVAALNQKLGPILFQLPPFSKQNLELLDTFLRNTSSVEKKVFEFRHSSWLDDATYTLLSQFNAGFCISETEDLKPVLKTTGKLCYVRLRNESYSSAEIDDWADKIRKIGRDVNETYVYLRHDESGDNASLAERLSTRI